MVLDQETLEDIQEFMTPLPEFILVVRERKGNTNYSFGIWVPRTNLEPTYRAKVVSPGKHPHQVGDTLLVNEHCGTDFTLTIDDQEIWVTALEYDTEVFGSYE
jgi:co-chaperonin GroES (HSP10)